MEVILARFSAAELRAKSTEAVQEELQSARAHLSPAVGALRRALTVVQASKSLCKIAVVFVDESPQVAQALEQLVAACNEVGTLVCQLNRAVSSSGASDASSDTEEEEGEREEEEGEEEGEEEEEENSSQHQRAEPKDLEHRKTSEEKKRAAKETDREEKDAEVEEEAGDVESKENPRELKRPRIEDSSTNNSSTDDAFQVPRTQDISSTDRVSENTTPNVTVAPFADKASLRKRMDEERTLSRLRKEALTRIGSMNRLSRLGKFVSLVLVAAVGLSEEEADPSPIESFASAACTAGSVLIEADSKVSTAPFMDDMRLGMAIALPYLKRQLSRADLLAAWKIVKLLKQLRDTYPSMTRPLYRNHCQLRKHLLELGVPAEVVGVFKTGLQEMVAEVDVWMTKRCIGKSRFDQKLALIDELLEHRFEMWDPRVEPMLGEAISKLERVRSLQKGSEWGDIFSSICGLCKELPRTAFVWTADVTSPPSTIVTKSGSQKGFDNAARVEKDFSYVTTYGGEVRHTFASSDKMKAFDELIDRLQWIFNTIRWTADSTLLPLDRLCELNRCFDTLAKLCDNGNSLNMEGCIHLEKLLCSIRQVMYMRQDYAAASKWYVHIYCNDPNNATGFVSTQDLSQVYIPRSVPKPKKRDLRK